MSNFKPKPDSGTLFHNRYKKNDNQPDYTGTYATEDGKVRQIAAWQNGDYLSIKFSDPYEAEKAS